MGISAHVAPKEAMMNRWVGVLQADVGWEHLGMSMKVTKTTSGVTLFTVCRERRENLDKIPEKHQYLWDR